MFPALHLLLKEEVSKGDFPFQLENPAQNCVNRRVAYTIPFPLSSIHSASKLNKQGRRSYPPPLFVREELCLFTLLEIAVDPEMSGSMREEQNLRAVVVLYPWLRSMVYICTWYLGENRSRQQLLVQLLHHLNRFINVL
jgi:hypothetical protein